MRFPRIRHREINFCIKELKKVGINVVVFDKSRIEDSLADKLSKFLIELQDFLKDTGFHKFFLVLRKEGPMCWYSISLGRIVINLAMLVFNNPEHKEKVGQTVAEAKEIEALTKGS